MKKFLLFFASFLMLSLAGVDGQNLLVNGDFENWDDASTPTGWTKAENVAQETTIIQSGSSAVKQIADGTKDIAQTIAVTEGQTYRISLWYYIESGDGTDARIWSYWKDASGTVTNNANELRGPNDAYFPDEKGEWKNYEIVLTAPTGVIELSFEVRAYGTAVVYWDNFVVEEYTPTGTLELTTPNGGESYDTGQQVQFAWNSTNVSSVYFEILGDGGSWEPITDNIPSVDGANTYDFTIPANAWGWDQYKLRVVDASAPSINDESDAVFTVVGHDVELLWEDFGGGTLGSFDEVSVSGTNTWIADEYSGTTFAKMSGNNNGINEDWLISSAINLDNSTDEILEFQTACNYSGDDIVVKYSIDYDGQGDPSTATWTEFPAYTLSAGSWAWTHSGYIDLGSITGSIHVAFIFTCSETASKTWEVTDIYVSGINDSSTSVDSQKASEVVISPNPFSNELYIKGTKELQNIILFNTAGQVVMNNQSGSKRVSTANLPKGMYIVQVKFMDGTSTTQKVIKK
ncbi:T9SS type A sorting domain-containing protein [Carboxylicivirga sediminis]|uniref:T9SS type A sorting domain-containing protein n=1 Tax=Carboxylicivirga sediminis TaxID=2006564 RepID=A0A941IXU2_9BACT|nr:T9SS type A sorting domain-containing protein [Carboxylicivirga sediminis]MBR8535107.1 T9SS type A sorting domain-containing protein [Carboxylicivirga sediminis]